MTRRVRPQVARLAGALTAVLAIAALALAVAEGARPGSPTGPADLGLAIFETFAYTMIAMVGTVVATRQPRNACGWLLLLIAVSLSLNSVVAHLYHQARLRGDPMGSLEIHAAWVGSWLWILPIVTAFIIFPLLFPTGRPLSSRWGWLVRVALAISAVLMVSTALIPGPFAEFAVVTNPYGLRGAAVDVVSQVCFFALVLLAFVSIASVALRFRRATGVERQQIRWVATAVLLLPVAFLTAGVGGDGDVGYAVLLLGLVLVGAAVGVAMLRYRLYDLSVVINRTLVYGAVTATLVAAYVGGVLLLQLVLGPVTERNDLAVAGSTLAVAGLFRPVRARIQRAVDRRFYRTRYDAGTTLAAFQSALRDRVDLDALGQDLRVAVGEAMQPTHVALWLRPSSAARHDSQTPVG